MESFVQVIMLKQKKGFFVFKQGNDNLMMNKIIITTTKDLWDSSTVGSTYQYIEEIDTDFYFTI